MKKEIKLMKDLKHLLDQLKSLEKSTTSTKPINKTEGAINKDKTTKYNFSILDTLLKHNNKTKPDKTEKKYSKPQESEKPSTTQKSKFSDTFKSLIDGIIHNMPNKENNVNDSYYEYMVSAANTIQMFLLKEKTQEIKEDCIEKALKEHIIDDSDDDDDNLLDMFYCIF